tara:strand:- start:498 stop:779 length:282 start_codon:yes stop_codon:yes gene_type:complete
MAKTELELLEGWDFVVEYDFDPGEPEVLYYPDGSGHPGSPPEVSVHSIWLQLPNKEGAQVEVEMTEFLMSAVGLDKSALEDVILEEEKEGYED